MNKFAALALTAFCIASLSCQSYTGGLQKTMARADETAATAALHTIAVAQQTYAVSNDGAFATFQQLCAGGYLEARFNSDRPALKDYVLSMEVTPKSDERPEFFSCNADPAGDGALAGRHFYIDSTANGLHANPTAPATANDPVVQP
jgi:hypothetical protein